MSVTPGHRQTRMPPSKSAISPSGAPCIRRRLENVFRKSCHRNLLIAASTSASSNQCRLFFSGSPVLADGNTGPPLAPSVHNPRAAIASSCNGTCRDSSFFVRGMFNVLEIQSTMSQVSRYWLPLREPVLIAKSDPADSLVKEKRGTFIPQPLAVEDEFGAPLVHRRCTTVRDRSHAAQQLSPAPRPALW
jgi:hypothetical protein